MPSMEDVRTIATGLDHPEGVALGSDGMLYAGGEAGQIYRVDPDSGDVEQIASTGGFVLGLCLDAAGAVYVCDAALAEIVRVDPASGAAETWSGSDGAAGFVCPNWPAFAPDGSLYFSDSGPEDPDLVDGRIFRVPPGGGDAEALDLPPLHFPNGLAVRPDGALVVLESFTPRLSAIVAGGIEEVATFPGTVPDGVAVDAEGGYVVSAYYPYHVYRVPASGGTPELVLHDVFGMRFPMPTNVCFFGPGLTSLAIASLGGHALTAVELGIAGAPLFYP